VTVTDDDTGSDTKTATVRVTNVAPVLALNAVVGINENGTAMLSGTITDPGTLDTFTVVVDWGDGSAPQTFTYGAETTAFSETHQYLDDSPTATAADDYTITVTVTDDDTGSDTKTATVRVTNVAPVLALNAVLGINENGTATLSGTITDPGTLDTFTVVVDWGDGSAPQTFTYAAGTTTFSETHQYLDDNPTATAADDYTITVTVTDDDTGSDTKTATVRVTNVAPVLALNAVAGILENGMATLSGTITDPGTLDTFTVVVDWGDGSVVETYIYLAGTTTFSATHLYADNGAVEQYTITVAVADDDTGAASETTAITVANVPPTIALSGPPTVDEGSTYTLTLDEITDPGTDSVTEWIVHWGDGTSDTYASGGDVTHVYADDDPPGTAADPYTITVDLVDEDGTHESAGIKLITVQNVAPQVWVGEDAAIEVGDTFTSTGGVVDPGADSWTAVVDYGDGSEVQPLNLNADKTFSLSHVYAEEGVYFVTVTAGDDDLGGGEERLMVHVAARTYPWQNRRHACDVTDDGWITAGDVLASINEINNRGARELSVPPLSPQLPPPYFDVSRDNWLTAQDVLLVINYINKYGSGPIPDAPPAVAWMLSDGLAAGGEGESRWAELEAGIFSGTDALAAHNRRHAAADERFPRIDSRQDQHDRWMAQWLADAAREWGGAPLATSSQRPPGRRETLEDVLTLPAEQRTDWLLGDVLEQHDAVFALWAVE